MKHLDKIRQWQAKDLQKDVDNRLNKIEELKKEVKVKQEKIKELTGE